MTPIIYFLHGRDSHPRSLKIRHLSDLARKSGWKVVVPDFSSTTDPEERVRMFLALDHNPNSKNVFVGSSMGAYVALVASRVLKPDALLLLAPALSIDGYAEPQPEPVATEAVIVHGWDDDLIAAETVFAFAGQHRATLHLVNDEHALQQSIPFIGQVLSDLLQRCSAVSRLSRLTASL